MGRREGEACTDRGRHVGSACTDRGRAHDAASPVERSRHNGKEPGLRVAYIDPQSYHGLAKYDLGYLCGLLDGGFDGELLFYCSTLFDARAPAPVEVRPIFDYNRKRSPILKAVFYLRSMARLALDALSKPADVYHFQWFKLPWLDLLFVAFLQKVAGARGHTSL